MPTKHYTFGGSTAGRTLQCPAWIPLTKKMPSKDSSSPDADRGTLLHDCMEALLKDPELETSELLGRTYKDQKVTQEDIDEAIIPALNAYLDFAEKNDFLIELLEQEVRINDSIGGTSDVIAVNSDTVFILDWKFGYNKVSAEDNSQGLFYAMCAKADPNTAELFSGRDKLCVVIVQPQCEGVLDAWFTTLADLDDFTEAYLEAVKEVDEDSPCAGEYCKFCPAMPICPIKTGAARKAVMLDPKTMDGKELGAALQLAYEVEEWARSVQKLAHEQAELGQTIEGFKLVDKRATRKWVDEDEVLDSIRKSRKIKLEEAVDMKLKSPAQLEKIMKKKGIDFKLYDDYIVTASSGTTLAKADDKRPEAFNVNAFTAAIQATE